MRPQASTLKEVISRAQLPILGIILRQTEMNLLGPDRGALIARPKV